MSESERHADTVDRIEGRPSPRRMALPCIFDEVEELTSRVGGADHDDLDTILARFDDLSHCLESRLDVEYPDCPECGGHLGRTEEGDVICWERHHELPDDVLEKFDRADGRLWGRRGHNGGAR